MATLYTDSSGEEFVPNSQSDDKEDDNISNKVPVAEGSSQEAVEQDEQSEPEFDCDTSDKENVNGRDHTRWARKRRRHHGNKARKKRKKMHKRGKYARNYSRSDKLKCCDIDEIRRFVRFPPCCCKDNCLNKFKEVQSRATAALSNLRNARFASRSRVSWRL